MDPINGVTIVRPAPGGCGRPTVSALATGAHNNGSPADRPLRYPPWSHEASPRPFVLGGIAMRASTVSRWAAPVGLAAGTAWATCSLLSLATDGPDDYLDS
jgi:hypothetical protein